jgi:hypothetical protein
MSVSRSDSSDGSQSDSDMSNSPVPSSVDDNTIPENCIVIRYESIDPTNYLENPENLFGVREKEFLTTTLNDEIGTTLSDLLDQYKNVMAMNVEISNQAVKTEIGKKNITNGDVYNLLDKMYTDIPDVFNIDASFLNGESLNLFIQKQNLHKIIRQNLEKIGNSLAIPFPLNAFNVYQNEKRAAQEEDSESCKHGCKHGKEEKDGHIEDADDDSEEEEDEEEEEEPPKQKAVSKKRSAGTKVK